MQICLLTTEGQNTFCYKMGMMETSPHVMESIIWESFAFVIHNPGIWALKSRIQLKESRPPPVVGIWNPSSTDKESRIQYLESGIQDCLVARNSS